MKYERFKEWFIKKEFKIKRDVHWMDPITVFRCFEIEQEEKEKEIKIKYIIAYAMFDSNYNFLSPIDQEKVTSVYENLKQNELIK